MARTTKKKENEQTTPIVTRAAKKDAANWYDCYMSVKKRAEEAEKKLLVENAEKETLRAALKNAAQMTCPECCPGKKGEQNNE